MTAQWGGDGIAREGARLVVTCGDCGRVERRGGLGRFPMDRVHRSIKGWGWSIVKGRPRCQDCSRPGPRLPVELVAAALADEDRRARKTEAAIAEDWTAALDRRAAEERELAALAEADRRAEERELAALAEEERRAAEERELAALAEERELAALAEEDCPERIGDGSGAEDDDGQADDRRAGEPTQAAVAASRRAIRLILEHYLEDQRLYDSDWSDARIAALAELSTEAVAGLRERFAGPIRDLARESRDAARRTFARRVEALRRDLFDELARVRADIVERLEDGLRAIEDEIG